MDYDNTNRGSIWKNDKKKTEKHPDFTGTLDVEGTQYWVSAWKRKSGSSDKAPALSFSIKLKEEKPIQQQKQSVEPEFDDDIPFS